MVEAPKGWRGDEAVPGWGDAAGHGDGLGRQPREDVFYEVVRQRGEGRRRRRGRRRLLVPGSPSAGLLLAAALRHRGRRPEEVGLVGGND